jgi:hypothetical protein
VFDQWRTARCVMRARPTGVGLVGRARPGSKMLGNTEDTRSERPFALGKCKSVRESTFQFLPFKSL